MSLHPWKSALALGAVLAATGAAGAGDRDTLLLSGGPAGSTTMTLGGKGTAAKAATEDTELAGHGGHGGGYHGGGYHGGGYHGWHGGYGGYRGGYYGGYRGGYYGGYRGYGYGYSSFYRGGYYGGYYRPYYAGYYGYGLGLGYGGYYGGYGYGYPAYYSAPCASVYIGIAGGTGSGAPVVNLGTSFARPVDPPPMAQPAVPGDGTFPYDGGPSSPVPLPKADPGAIPQAGPSTATDLPISGKSKSPFAPATTPYKYKAYGEK